MLPSKIIGYTDPPLPTPTYPSPHPTSPSIPPTPLDPPTPHMIELNTPTQDYSLNAGSHSRLDTHTRMTKINKYN